MYVCVFVIAATDILTKKPNFLIICVSPHRFSLSYFLSVLYFLAEAASVWPKLPVFLFFSSIFDWHFNTPPQVNLYTFVQRKFPTVCPPWTSEISQQTTWACLFTSVCSFSSANEFIDQRVLENWKHQSSGSQMWVHRPELSCQHQNCLVIIF